MASLFYSNPNKGGPRRGYTPKNRRCGAHLPNLLALAAIGLTIAAVLRLQRSWDETGRKLRLHEAMRRFDARVRGDDDPWLAGVAARALNSPVDHEEGFAE